MRVRSNFTDSKRVQLSAWRIPPSIWLRIPSGLTASPLSTAATTRNTRTVPSLRSTLTSMAAARYAARFLYRANANPLPRPSRRRYFLQPKRSAAVRITATARGSSRCRTLRSMGSTSPERSQRRDSERHRRNEAVVHLQVRYPIERQRIAIATARRQWDRLGRRRTEAPLEEPTWHQRTGSAGTGGVGVARDLVLPPCDVAPFIE